MFSYESKQKVLERVVKMGFNQLESMTFIQMYRGVPFEKFETLKRVVNQSI